MADDDEDFTFGQVDDDFSGDDDWGSLDGDPEAVDFEGAESGANQPESDPAVVPVARGNSAVSSSDQKSFESGSERSSYRMILSGLLVIVLSAAGFYYFTTSPLPPVAVQQPAQTSQTVAMPERPESAVVVPTLDTAEKPSGKAVAPVKKMAAEVNQPVAGTYSIQAVTDANPLNRDAVLKKIRQLGFDAQVVPFKKGVPMTRLLIGVYPPEEAEKMALSLGATIPGVFILHQGNRVAVYAGSFSSQDRARVFVEALSRKGVQVSEQQAEVELTLYRVTFGSFPDRAAAVAAGARAQAIGLDADIVRNR